MYSYFKTKVSNIYTIFDIADGVTIKVFNGSKKQNKKNIDFYGNFITIDELMEDIKTIVIEKINIFNQEQDVNSIIRKKKKEQIELTNVFLMIPLFQIFDNKKKENENFRNRIKKEIEILERIKEKDYAYFFSKIKIEITLLK